MRPRISIWGSVCRLVRRFVMRFYFQTAEFEWKQHRNHRITIPVNVWKITCPLTIETTFLDASTHLYKRDCLSVCQLVRPSVHLGPSVGPSVGLPFFFQIAEIDKSDKSDKSDTCKSDISDRILQIWQISLCNSILVPYYRRIFV